MGQWSSGLGTGDRWLLGLAVAALGAMTVELSWRYPIDVLVERTDARADIGAPIVYQTSVNTSSNAYLALAERPLFTVNRRPYEPPRETLAEVARPQAPPPPPRVEFVLNAVITAPATRIAFLKVDGSPELRKLALGESHDGWTLVDVRPASVVLESGGRMMTVELERRSGPPVGTAGSGSTPRGHDR
jgi:hypothetical protein